MSPVEDLGGPPDGAAHVPMTREEAGIEYLGDIDIYGPAAAAGYDADDWMKGLESWPWPNIDNADDMRAQLLDGGDTVQAFHRSLLYERWVGRLPWLKDV